jgi:hypothetical protein
MVGIRNGLTAAKYQVLHEANDEDSLEAILINIWKSKKHFSIVNLYNPPTNLLSLQCVAATLQPNSIIVGDFNAPSTRWGYIRSSQTGHLVEEFIDDYLLDIIPTEPTFLSYAGHSSRPDLVITHPNLTDNTVVKLLDDASGCGHRALLVKTTIIRGRYNGSLVSPDGILEREMGPVQK